MRRELPLSPQNRLKHHSPMNADIPHQPNGDQRMQDELLSKEDARQALGGIGNTKFYQLLNQGKIKAVKIGKSLRVRRSEIDRFISTLPEYKTGV